jgi:hypothetical protein
MLEKHNEEARSVKEEKKPEKAKSEADKLKDTLIYIRDNVVHGNKEHVDRINRALNG